MDLDVEFGFTSLICTKHVWFGGLKTGLPVWTGIRGKTPNCRLGTRILAQDFWLQDLINGLKSSKL